MKEENNKISEKKLMEWLKNTRMSMTEEKWAFWLANQVEHDSKAVFMTDEEADNYIERYARCLREYDYKGGMGEIAKEAKQLKMGKEFTLAQHARWLIVNGKAEKRFHKPTIHTKAHEALSPEDKIVSDLLMIGLLCLGRQSIDKLSVLCLKFVSGMGIDFQFIAVLLDGTEVNLDYHKDVDYSDREKEAVYEAEDFLPPADKMKITALLKGKSEKRFEGLRKKAEKR